MPSSHAASPPRGTRPRNRRELLLLSAADLFAERGYSGVSMKDVAAASNISPSSLYAHFASKSDLLRETIADQIDRSSAFITGGGTDRLEAISTSLASSVLAHRSLGVLWQREARNLDSAAVAELRRKMADFGAVVEDDLRAARPELTTDQAALLTQCALGAVTSISFHRQSLPEPEFATLLRDLCLRMLLLAPATASDRSRRGADRVPPPAGGRRGELADAAIRLFARHGFSAVTIDDIGAAVGIAGPSVYKHVASKQELLQNGFANGTAALRASFDACTAGAADPAAALREVTDSYVSVALDHADLITVLIADAHHLAPDERSRARRNQRDYIDAWAALIHTIRVESDAVTRIKIQAAQMVANDIGRTPRLHRGPAWRETVRAACWALQQ